MNLSTLKPGYTLKKLLKLPNKTSKSSLWKSELIITIEIEKFEDVAVKVLVLFISEFPLVDGFKFEISFNVQTCEV